MSRTTRINARPVAGGRLVTTSSAEKAGLDDYVVKRNWRRVQDAECQAEGHDFYLPEEGSPLSTQTLKLGEFDGPINLIHQAERPNGQKVVIVGTRTSLYASGLNQRAVYYDGRDCPGGDADDCDACGHCRVFKAEDRVYEDEDGKSNIWRKIGTGFDSEFRWEADNINGYCFLSNGTDLPVTYRVEDDAVVPVYELRDLGYENFGTVAAYVSMQFLGDCRLISEEDLERIYTPRMVSNPNAMAKANTPTTVEFSTPLTPKYSWIHWIDGSFAKTTTVIDEQNVNVQATTDKLPEDFQRFSFRVHASQTGSNFSALSCKYGTTAGNNLSTVDGDGNGVDFFSTTSAGDESIVFVNGWTARIGPANRTARSVELVDENGNPAVPPKAYVRSPFRHVMPGSRTVVASDPVFSKDDVGKSLTWDSGNLRVITAYVDPTHVEVDADHSIADGAVTMENPATYGRIPSSDYRTIRRHFMVAWSMLHEPRRYGANYTGTMEYGSLSLVLDRYTKAVEPGMTLTVAGAGTHGGNLTANVVAVLGHKVVTLDAPAKAEVHGALVQATDSINSPSGFDEPPGDYSAILKMLELSGTLVIYKENSLILATFTGRFDVPFGWQHIPLMDNQALHYRHTLILVSGQRHYYAGRNNFLAFDMGNRAPSIIGPLELAKNLFFDHAKIEDTETIYACDNAPAQEIWFALPVGLVLGDNTICHDYRFGTVRTTDVAPTAACSTDRPYQGVIREGTSWFVMALQSFPKVPVLCLYGLCADPVDSWGDKKSIFYRRETTGSTEKKGYECVFQSGLDWAQAPSFQRLMTNYTLHLSSHSPSPDVPLTVDLLGTDTISNHPRELDTFDLLHASRANMVPVNFMEFLYADRITLHEKGNPTSNGCAIVMRAYRLLEIGVEDHGRVYQ